MNREMLKYLVELSGGEVDVIDIDRFFKKFPKSKSMENDLAFLQRMGYISVLYADDGIEAIGVNQYGVNAVK